MEKLHTYHSYENFLTEKGELACIFPSRLFQSLDAFDWLFTRKPEEGLVLDHLSSRLLCIAGECVANGKQTELVNQSYIAKGYKDGFIFLYCLNDLSWSHYAVPSALQDQVPSISRSIFDVLTGERFDFHILKNGMVLTILARYATSCVTIHNAVLWHAFQPSFPPTRRICAVEVVKMSACYRCHQFPNNCHCEQNQQRVHLTEKSAREVESKKDLQVSLSNTQQESMRSEKLEERIEGCSNSECSSKVPDFSDNSTCYHKSSNTILDPNTVATLFGPWKGTKRAFCIITGDILREKTSFFQLSLNWGSTKDIHYTQSKFFRGMFGSLFNPVTDLVLSSSADEEDASLDAGELFSTTRRKLLSTLEQKKKHRSKIYEKQVS
eukprot:jgi/Galph1/2947/GphlegSOOS_G1644.1